MSNIIKTRLKKERIRLKLSQEKLADLAKVNRSMLSKWENENEKSLPDTDSMLRLCEVLQIDLGYLVGYTDIPHNQTAFIAEKTGLTTENVERLCNLSKLDDRTIYDINQMLSLDYWSKILNEIVEYMETPPFDEFYYEISERPYDAIRLTHDDVENAYLLSLLQILRKEKERRNKTK